MASAASHENVKVVLIDTHYVVTDAMSFKSVVQSLTGKDSCVEWIEESSFTGTKRKRPVHSYNDGKGNSAKQVTTTTTAVVGGDWRLSKGLSFKDLDGMILEQPAMEEWQQLFAQYNLL